jgi:hypothetical protein
LKEAYKGMGIYFYAFTNEPSSKTRRFGRLFSTHPPKARRRQWAITAPGRAARPRGRSS